MKRLVLLNYNYLGIELSQRIRLVIGNHEKNVPLHVPEFRGRERELVADCIENGWVSSVGSYVDEFEAEVARWSGCAYGVAVSSGTAALHISLLVAGVNSGDEVLVPTLTFVATANAVSYTGAAPHFIDSSYDTLGVCAVRLRGHLEKVAVVSNGQTYNRRTGKKIAAIVPMHAFGCPVEIDELEAVVADWPMVIVEDAAESLGSRYKHQFCGSFGDLAAVSFNGNKIVTTGGGGAVVTNNKEFAIRAKHLSTTAKLAHHWNYEHDEIAYNYRLPNINAALGVAQLEQLEDRLKKKQRLFESYTDAFVGLDGAKLFQAPEKSTPNNWLITVMLDENDAEKRDKVLLQLNEAGIHCRPVWTPLHRLPIYQRVERADLTQAEDLEYRIINIPSSAYLGSFKEFIA